MNKGLKKAVVFCLSAGMMISALAGCAKKEEEAPAFDTTKAAVTVGDASVSAGVMNVAVRYTQTSLESLYMQFGLADPFNSDIFGNGSTLGEDVKADLANTLGEALLAEQHMADYGVEITDEDKASVAYAAEAFMSENDEATLAAIGVDKESVERFLELYMIKTKVEAQMSADVDTVVSDEEAAQRTVNYVLFSADAEKEALEAETETEEVAEAATEAVEAATPEEETAALEENEAEKTQSAAETELATEAVEAATPEDETEAVEPETEDPEKAPYIALAKQHAEEMIAALLAGGEFEEVAESFGKTPSDLSFGADYFMPQMVEATEGLEDGAVVETPVRSNGDSFYVMQVVSAFDVEATEAEKVEIVEQRKSDRIEELYTQWSETTPIETDAAVMAEITFNDFSIEQIIEQSAEEESEIAVEIETEAETE